jgi:hypothetical protein
MRKRLQITETESAPLYVRWTPERCPYALEMKLELITRLKVALAEGERQGVEIGGVWVGSLPTAEAPTLRLDDLMLVPRRLEDGPVYVLDPEQQLRLSELTESSRATEGAMVGFFRSQMRRKELVPADSDRGMLAQQFPDGHYAFLLVESREPRQAAFFLPCGAALSDQPAMPAFPFDETAFQTLPELPAEATEDIRNFNFLPPQKSNIHWIGIAGAALLVALIAFWTFGDRLSQYLRPASNQVDLSVAASGGTLKISWDHSSPVLSTARGATLVINDGPSHRELRMDTDDLRMGQVDYERLTKKVFVIMMLDAPNVKMPPQTFDWSGN